MSFLVVMIVDDPDKCPEILDAWNEIGVSGVTILESSGLGRLRKAALRDDIPLIPRLEDFLSSREVHHRTLLSVVKDEEVVERMVQAVQEITGSLDLPHTGILFVLPVIKAYGLNRKSEE
jgi:nitrogen regulatory protein PII